MLRLTLSTRDIRRSTREWAELTSVSEAEYYLNLGVTDFRRVWSDDLAFSPTLSQPFVSTRL